MPELTSDKATAPIAKKHVSERNYHGYALSDNYFWLKDSSYPVIDDDNILDYLRSENSWFDRQMEPRKKSVNLLFEEMKGRLEDDEAGVPWNEGGYTYRWRFAAGSQYRIWERRPLTGGDYVVILDEPKEAGDGEFFAVSQLEISPNSELLAWLVDDSGAERDRLVIDNLVTGERFSEGLDSLTGNIVWAGDKALFYTPVEEDSGRAERVMHHILGSDAARDKLVFNSQNKGLFLSLQQSQSDQYLFIVMADHQSSEVRFVDLDEPTGKAQLVAKRRENVMYTMDHGNDQFYILVNDEHANFRVATAPVADPEPKNWRTLLAPSDDIYYRDINVFKDFLAVEEMSNALSKIRIRSHSGDEHYVKFPEPLYTSSLGYNPAYDTPSLRVSYESMITPDSTYDYQLSKRELVLLKRQVIPSGFDPSAYVTERRWAPTRDGVKVPISLVYRNDVSLDGKAPLYLTAYGAYGSAMAPSFSALRLSLLERGVVFAIAHVRGGDELGYSWYLDGKLDQRLNTFNDFIDSAQYLIKENYSEAGRIAISGGSAGGELVGAAIIQAPQLWGAAVLDVPFVDVLNTMLDASLPLTPPEWQEWGNPIESKEVFEFIRSYSPYDNIESRDYPPMLVTGGLNDPRVTYWEPAKWTAKMRALKTDNNELIMKIDMEAGHGGKSGRYDSVYEFAEQIAFILDQLDVEN
jgi:oligopeptidase B